MNELLQVDTYGAVCADDLVRAHAGVGGHVTAGIIESHIGRIIAHDLMRAVQRRMHELRGKAAILRHVLPSLFRLLTRALRLHRNDGKSEQKPGAAFHSGVNQKPTV